MLQTTAAECVLSNVVGFVVIFLGPTTSSSTRPARKKDELGLRRMLRRAVTVEAGKVTRIQCLYLALRLYKLCFCS